MNIHFDLVHPSDVNLFKNAIIRLHKEGHEIFLTLRERGRLSEIAKTELSSFEICPIGKHESRFFNKLYALVKREFQLFQYLKNKKIQISVNQGFSSVISCKLLNIPFIIFEDDYEYKLAFHYARLFSKRDVMPDFIPVTGKNIYKYHGFKELAYLHPNQFMPDNNALKLFGILPGEYAFIREISNISLNYAKRKSYLLQIIENLISRGIQIVLSIEDKTNSSRFEHKCIVLEEPVHDIYSIIANASFAISSGDTMAREACLLGTPTIYTGGREMIMNSLLIEKGILFADYTIENINLRIDYLLDKGNVLKIRAEIGTIIKKELEDTTEVIIKHVQDFI